MSVELLAPAGEFKTALSAFAAGADAVYCGLAEYSARAFAQNLTLDELKLLVRFAHANKKKVYVTFNTLVCEDEIEGALETLSRLAQIRPDALIVQDIGIASLCKKHFPELELHASTQMAVHNLEGVLQLKELGFKRVVLARELSLEEIASIVKRSGTMEIECFIHGALCYSISGLCLYGAMEKSRSGNRGRCPYCCRVAHEDAAGGKRLQFSMKDLRLDEDVLKLVDAGVKSLKIEGRMKSDFYVASAVKYYRQIISGADFGRLTKSDLETVFSRRTTKLYFDGLKNASSSPIDPTSLGHLGAEIGVVKRVTKDREGLSWLRFHTSRALERHDGLQFGVCDENGKPLGLGIGEMRQAISRRNVFEVSAGTDVEVLLPEKDGEEPIASKLKPGVKIYCSASQAVRRMFPQQSIRPSDYMGDIALDVEVKLEKDRLCASAEYEGRKVEVSFPASLDAAKNPAKTEDGVRKAFLKLGESDYCLGSLKVVDNDRLFSPMSLLNDLRRMLVEDLDELCEQMRVERVERALAEASDGDMALAEPIKTLKITNGAKVPEGDWDEIVISIYPGQEPSLDPSCVRLALPVYTRETDFNKLRVMVKNLLRRGYVKWEAADLATLALLKRLGVQDLTADWSLYAFNSYALDALSKMGVKRFVASPENDRENLQYLAESGYQIEFLKQQSTPLFISLTPSASKPADLVVYQRAGLWITTKPSPRVFDVPEGVSTRIDLSWEE